MLGQNRYDCPGCEMPLAAPALSGKREVVLEIEMETAA